LGLPALSSLPQQREALLKRVIIDCSVPLSDECSYSASIPTRESSFCQSQLLVPFSFHWLVICSTSSEASKSHFPVHATIAPSVALMTLKQAFCFDLALFD